MHILLCYSFLISKENVMKYIKNSIQECIFRQHTAPSVTNVSIVCFLSPRTLLYFLKATFHTIVY